VGRDGRKSKGKKKERNLFFTHTESATTRVPHTVMVEGLPNVHNYLHYPCISADDVDSIICKISHTTM